MFDESGDGINTQAKHKYPYHVSDTKVTKFDREDSRERQLEDMKMFFDRSNDFATVQKLRTRGSKA